MKTHDFFVPVSSTKLVETFEKQLGSQVNLEKYTREQLEDMRNKLRTRVFQHEGSSKYNDLLTNEVYQRDKAMLQLLNTRIKEMLGEAKKGVRDVKRTKKSKGTKPDFLDMDKDGNKTEPMKKAIKDKKVAESHTGSVPQVGDEVYYRKRRIGWYKGYDQNTNKVIIDPDVEEVGDDYINRDLYWDADAVTIKPAQQDMLESPDSNKAAAKKAPSAAERAKTRDQQRTTAAKKARDTAQRKGITQDKDGTYHTKESKMKEEVKKSEIPAALRKAKGGDWKVSQADLDKEANSSRSSAGGLEKEKAKLRDKGMMEEPADKSRIPAAHRKAKGGDWKVSLSDLDKEASKSRSSKAGLDKEKAELKSKGMMEADKPSAGMTKKEKSAVVKKARAGKDIGKSGKGFEKVAKAAKKGGARDPEAVAAAAMWKQQAKESFRRNVKVVNESLAHYIMEDEEGKAKTITAASDIVNDFTSWMQRVGQYQTKAIIELADAIRADFGVQQAEAFKQTVAPALAATLETLTQQREAISNAVAVLAGEDIPPEEQMGMEPEVGPESPDMEPVGPDMMNEPGDEFGASDAAAGPGLTGREMRESRFAQRLAESHSIMSKLAR